MVCLASSIALTYVYAALSRIDYPFELEWMEGGVLQHVTRILDGEEIYCKPGLEHVPFLYTPLYYYVSALFALLMGHSFLPLRLVSFLSSLFGFGIIYMFVRKETSDRFAGFMAAAMFAAMYKIAGGWFDVARSDSLFIAMLLWGLYVFRFASTRSSLVLGGLLVGLAFLVKQTALIVFLPVGIAAFVHDRRRGLLFLGSTVFLIGATTLVFNHVSNGWYSYYVFELAGRHPIERQMFFDFWQKDLFRPLAIAMLFSIAAFAIPPPKPTNGFSLFYIPLIIGAMGGSWLSRLHSGGFVNVLMPVYSVVAILFGLGLAATMKRIGSMGQSGIKLNLVVFVAVLIQFLSLAFDPSVVIPKPSDALAGRKVVQRIRELEGDVFVPNHSFLLASAGKRSHAHRMAIDDIIRTGDPLGLKLARSIESKIEEKEFDAIIVHADWFRAVIVEQYIRTDRVLFPSIGWAPRREWVFLPKPPPENREHRLE